MTEAEVAGLPPADTSVPTPCDADLVAVPPITWPQVAVPAGWEAIASIARQVGDELDPLTRRITRCIAEEIDAYAAGVVPIADLGVSVKANVRAILVGLAEHRPPTTEEVAVRRELGGQRALQGLPIDALIQAYHVGYRELWLRLVEAVPEGDQRTATQLLTAATTIWQWVHEVTDAIAATYAATVRAAEAQVVGARQRFVELLVGGDLDGSEAPELARTLGFDPHDSFAVITARGAVDALELATLQHGCEPLDGVHAVVSRGPLVLVVHQGASGERTTQALRSALPAAAIGVGVERPGLHGARLSLDDAEQALSITDDGGTARFDECWLWATLQEAGDRLAAVLAPGAAIADSHPHLAEAVTAFAGAGFSVSEAARRLSVHANTVGYRLERWEALTGWDPRTFTGLARSLAALRLRS